MIKKLLKFTVLGLVIAGLMALLMSRGLFMGTQKALQNKFYDFDSASAEIVIVTIDEKSLSANQLGNLQQWPRKHYADVIGILNEADTAAIGIDITFPDPSNYGESDDLFLANVLTENVVIAARYFFENDNRVIEWPNPTLMNVKPNVGWINVNLDEDGFVRQIPVFSQTDEGAKEALSIQLTRIYDRVEPGNYRVSKGIFQFSDDITIPVVTKHDRKTDTEVHLMYVNYFAEPGSFTRVSFVDVLEGRFIDKQGEQVDFKDKIVLIGPTAIDLQDDYLSPVSQGVRMPGVEIHANAVQTLITRRFLEEQSGNAIALTLAILLIVNVLIFSALKVRYALLIVMIEIIGMIIAGIVAYEYRTILNVIYPILLILLTFIGTFLLRFILEQKERKFIEGAFGHYVNKSVVEQIVKNPKLLELGGTKRTITTFFSDIAGFTTIAEQLSPEKLVKFLNEYLEEMTKIILKNQGTLDKYEGDAIMAFWNAPLDVTEHAKKACLSALENQEKLAQMQEKWVKEDKTAFRIRIGLNTGEAVVGNMGSHNRFNYTAMGDNVNLASRLESINKQYGTHIMLSEYTYTQVKDDFVCRELDQIRVKGKSEPVRIYELIGQKGAADHHVATEAYQKALEAYRQKRFAEAKDQFEALANDPPAGLLAARCNRFLKNPPEENWDGIWNFEIK